MNYSIESERDWPKSSIPNANNLDLLRFSFASMVFLVHAFHLSNAEPLHILGKLLSSILAVQCFFVVSGFLIFMSYEKSQSLNSYFEKRIRRIYPAYFVVVTACAFLGVLVSTESIVNYFTSPQLYKYLAANLVFLNFFQQDLPGVLSSNPLSTVNGALWTLKIEVMFYLSVPALVWLFHRIGLWQGLLVSYITSLAYRYGMDILVQRNGGIYVELQRQLPGQLAYFIAGGTLYYYFDWFKTHHRLLMILASLLLIFHHFFELRLIYPLALAIIVIFLGFFIGYLGRFGKYGDFSYGIYILHFPVLQTLIFKGFFDNNPWVGLLASILSILILAFFLWHIVEKPMLKKSSHYVQESMGFKFKMLFKRVR